MASLELTWLHWPTVLVAVLVAAVVVIVVFVTVLSVVVVALVIVLPLPLEAGDPKLLLTAFKNPGFELH